MPSRDLVHNVASVQLLAPVDKAHTNWTSQILDTAEFESAQLVFNAGAFIGADFSNLLTVTIEESDGITDASFTTVTGLDVQAPGFFVDNNPNFQGATGSSASPIVKSAGTASQVYALGYHGSKRYVRLRGSYTGATISAGIVGVIGQLSHALSKPVIAPAAITAT